MSIDFKTFLSIVPHIIEARFPILTRGRHGIGKSTLVYQLAKQMDLEVVERRGSQMTEGDLLGLPKVEDNVTQWLAPEWLHTACNKPDRKSTRLNSSHGYISYAVFCLKKKTSNSRIATGNPNLNLHTPLSREY